MSDQVKQMLDEANDASTKLNQLLDITLDIARKTIEDGDENLPQWILQDAEDNTSIFVTPWSDDKEKTMISLIIRVQIKKMKAVRLVFISEGWMVEAKKGEEIDCQPMHHPHRQEILMLNCEDQDGNKIFKHYPIVRPGNTLGEEILKGKYATSTGRFTNMFDEPR